MSTLGPDLQNEDILFFFLPTLVTITAATHTFPSGCWGPRLMTYLPYRRSLLTTQGYNDLLLHLDRGGKRDLRSGETHLRSHSREVPGRRDVRPASHSTVAGRVSRHKDSGKSAGLGVRSQHSFSNTPLTFLVSQLKKR